MIIHLAALVYSIVKAASAEGLIPVKYSLSGEVLRYGSPYTMVFLPAAMFVCGLVIVLVLHLVPAELMNIPVTVNEDNALRVYEETAFMTAVTVLQTALFSFAASVLFLKGSGMSLILSFLFLAAVLTTIIIYLARVRKKA